MRAGTARVRIGDVVSRVSTWNPNRDGGSETIRYIDLSSVNNETKLVEGHQSITAAEAPSRARQLVESGDILVSTVRPNLNGVARVPEALGGATASTGFCVLRSGHRVDGSYLFHWVKSPGFVAEMIRLATGQSYPAVSDRIIFDSEIPLPPLDEQRRIAAILDQADALRRKRRHSLFMHEELVNALTRSVLGDPVTNDRQWSEGLELGSVADIASGVTKGRRLDGKSTRTVPYLAVANVQERYLSLGNVKEIEATESEIERYRLMRDDLLLTEGGDPDKLGRGALWRGEIPDAIHQNHVFRVRLTTKQLRPTYLSWLIGSSRGKQYFLKAAKQTTGIASINMGQLKRFPLLVPPLEVQDRFERLVQAGEAQRVSRQKSLAALDSLFVSLQHRAFNEEL